MHKGHCTSAPCSASGDRPQWNPTLCWVSQAALACDQCPLLLSRPLGSCWRHIAQHSSQHSRRRASCRLSQTWTGVRCRLTSDGQPHGVLCERGGAAAAALGDLGRDATLGLVSGVCKLILQVANNTRVQGLQRFHDIVMRREPGQGLVTYSNHTSTFDDPGLESAMLPWHYFWTEHKHNGMRWTMCATDICFTNELLRQFFQSGKTLPIDRGAGVDQPSMHVMARRIAAGDWLHLFPEGRVMADGKVGPFKWGIGKVICNARAVSGRDPQVLPFFHSGMGRVMPFKKMVPRVGHTVEVVVGEPVDLSHITCRCGKQGEDQQQVWRDIAMAMRDALLELEPHVPPNPNQVTERPELQEAIRQHTLMLRRRRDEYTRSIDGSSSGGGSAESGSPSSSRVRDGSV